MKIENSKIKLNEEETSRVMGFFTFLLLILSGCISIYIYYLTNIKVLLYLGIGLIIYPVESKYLRKYYTTR